MNTKMQAKPILTRALVVAVLAILGYILSSSFWAVLLWGIAIIVAANPIVNAVLRRTSSKTRDADEPLVGPNAVQGASNVIVTGRARGSAAIVLSQALGIERSEAFMRLKEMPAIAATRLTEDQAQELVRRLQQAKVAPRYEST
ncbi:hypothetical protein ACGFJ7_27750 [Actinoplanes sp. NPDC048988]|uniref:hypothetical protein n=1 Tax=Actinoplanes sp. NPDC048988 TaxID=3363901 RepID=UPI003721158F